MWTLHSVTEETKKVIYVAAGILILVILSATFYSYFARFFTRAPQPIPPAMAFGNLPPIPFPAPSIKTPFHYTIDTVDGKVDIVNQTTGQSIQGFDRMYVYQILQTKADLGSLQQASTKVASIGFLQPNGAPLAAQRISDILYRWSQTTGLPQTIDMDISNFNFRLQSDYLTYPSIVSGTNAPNDGVAITSVQQFLNNMALFPTDVSTVPTTTDYVIQNGAMRLADPGEQVYAVRVNYEQLPLNGIQIVYPGNTNSTMSFLVTGGNIHPEIADATFFHQVPNVSSNTSSTYPIKTPQDAYTDLQNGNGYITPTYTGTKTAISIRSINLGYYIGEAPQAYAMPVYIFQGNDNFVAYVSAVDDHVLIQQTK